MQSTRRLRTSGFAGIFELKDSPPQAAGNASAIPFKGFTLIEIMVVMLLISIILGVAIPRFDSGALQDSQKVTTRRLTNIVSSLRTKAVAEQLTYALVIDISNDLYFIINEAMDEQMMFQAAENAQHLPKDIHFYDVTFSINNQIRSGKAEIHFHPAGYTDMAIIHMQTDSDHRYTYMIEPLLTKLRVIEEWVRY